MVNTETKLPQSVKDILQRYDINALITRTIPEDYSIPSASLEIYKTKTKFNSPVTLEMNDETVSKLKLYSSNYPNYSHAEILSYLIENVCDLSKIHTKDIAEALNQYYNIAETDKIRWTTILDAYADSLYYPTERKNNKRRNNTSRRFNRRKSSVFFNIK